MRLGPLSERSDYTFRSGTFDVRGWDVRTRRDGEKVGEVHDVIMDESDRPLYLDVDLGFLKRHVLLPLGQAEADSAEKTVWIPGLSEAGFQDIPEYDHDPESITSEYEARLTAAYNSAYEGDSYYSRPEYAATRPRMTGTTTASGARLATLDDLEDFKVADDDPDPRGWEVLVADGRVIGKIDQLIVDTEAMKVRYLECAVDENGLGLEERNRHVLIPAGFVRLNEKDKRAVVDTITSEDVATMPVHDSLPLEREQEERLQRSFSETRAPADRYGHPRYDADRFYSAGGERRV